MMNSRKRSGVFWGAAMLMATSAIGPGFLTQTTVFTQQLLGSFGFVILISILLDIGVQLNVWRIITMADKPAQEIAESVIPGMGKILTALIIFGGLAFNVGNIAGTGLGLEVITGMDNRIGAVISAIISVLLLTSTNASRIMDRFVQVIGFGMIALTLYVALVAAPPYADALHHSILPETISYTAIITIVGGTVGGYICFAGAHRLLEEKIPQENKVAAVSSAATRGILAASAMRIILFLAAFGIVSKGIMLDPSNPAADVFRQAAGNTGYRLFGIVMWSAAITSVIGSAYTSISFLKTWSPWLQKNHRSLVAIFIATSTLIFLLAGKPVKLLVMAGTINGFILPVSLLILLAAAHKYKNANGYQHPKWLTIIGVLIALALSAMALRVIFE